ncbi:arginase family protein [Alkalitalea saponilacus]|uniref:Arginase family enzyme n=1 Tax=Alkalitalea saponilacus TaxID=889453 RepID=A0A1T5HMI8_9BACT|nr:arginase family protein [Alkalitalea saponilacus]ASB49397.1 arginase [Alkalitalea saponilacus]SKC21849.1 Arginase family enzyme [Alkalitalea saponilacus]
MEIFHYFEPCNFTSAAIPGIDIQESLKEQVSFFNGKKEWFKDFEYDLILMGVPESRNGADNLSSKNSPDEIRSWLYSLRGFESEVSIADLGNIRGNTLNDRYHALEEAVDFLRSKGSVVLILGGTQDLSWSVYKALSKESECSIAIADALIDADAKGEDFTSRSWISFLLQQAEIIPEDLTVFGVQNYLVSPSQEQIITSKFFDIVRLAEIRGDGIEKCEAILRDSDFFSMDFRVIRDQPQFHDKKMSPHGCEPYEACRIMRYAGYSDRLKVVGLFEMPADTEGANSILGAELIWHFIDGYCGRVYDFPACSVDAYKCYVVQFDEFEEGIKFYRNLNNNRWWMEVNQKIVSCYYDDYRRALKKEFPEKWWRLYLKSTEGQSDMML